jgi:hypothetical protein
MTVKDVSVHIDRTARIDFNLETEDCNWRSCHGRRSERKVIQMDVSYQHMAVSADENRRLGRLRMLMTSSAWKPE